MLGSTRAVAPAKPFRSRDGFVYLYRVMKVLGWLPPESGPLRYVHISWFCVLFIFCIIYLPLGMLLSYVRNLSSFTPGEFLTSLQIAINAFGSSIKSMILYMLLWRLREVEKLLDKLDERLLNAADRQRIHNMVAYSKKVFIFYTFSYCSYTTSTFLTNVFSGRPAWSLYNPFFDWRDNWGYLWLHSTLEYIMISLAVLQDETTDTYPLMFIFIIRAHYKVLKEHISNLRADPEKSEVENYDELVQCVMDHKTILDCCALMYPVISATIFIQFLIVGSALGLVFVNIFFFSTTWIVIGHINYLLGVLMQSFPFCMCCELLMDDCQFVTNALFHSNWFDADRRYKSTMVYFLHRVQQPIRFVAGGIFPLSMASNIMVAKFSFSIIAIVLQLNLSEKFKKD